MERRGRGKEGMKNLGEKDEKIKNDLSAATRNYTSQSEKIDKRNLKKHFTPRSQKHRQEKSSFRLENKKSPRSARKITSPLVL